MDRFQRYLIEKDTMVLDPQCMKDEMSYAVTNRGELVPCCRCDDWETVDEPDFKRLLAVSKIEDYDTIDEILLQPEWIEFQNNLKNNKGPYACWYTCRINKPREDTQEHVYIENEEIKSKNVT